MSQLSEVPCCTPNRPTSDRSGRAGASRRQLLFALLASASQLAWRPTAGSTESRRVPVRKRGGQVRERSPRSRLRLLIDTDPAMGTIGGDPEDCFAVLYALHSPDVVVEGITVVQGNAPAEKGYANLRHLLELAGRPDVPVRRGELRPLEQRREVQIRFLEQRYGARQLAPMIEPPADEQGAVDFLIETVARKPQQITLVTIGPLTNVAAALRRSPDFGSKLQRIVMMGGTAETAGNISPAAEFNFWQDPEAADIVFRSGVPLTMVGLDVCHQTKLYPQQVEAVADRSKLGRFVHEASQPWFRIMANGEVGSEGFLHLYDTLAMAVAIDPTLVRLEDSHVAIEVGDGPAQGMSVSHHKPFQRLLFARPEINSQVALDVDVERFEALFQKRVLDRIATAG